MASATRESLIRLVPAMSDRIDALYQAELAKMSDDAKRTAGVEVGARAALAIKKKRADDKPSAATDYRPVTRPTR